MKGLKIEGKKIFLCLTIIMIGFSFAGCSNKSDAVKNDLGNAMNGTNKNDYGTESGMYDYNYDFSDMSNDLTKENGWGYTNGNGYWDYKGTSNGSANDSQTRYIENNTLRNNNLTNTKGKYIMPNTATDSTYGRTEEYATINPTVLAD